MSSDTIARRTRSSVKTASPPAQSSSQMAAALDLPLPEDSLQPPVLPTQSGPAQNVGRATTDYTPLAQVTSMSEKRAAVSDAAHSAGAAVSRAIEALPERYGPAVPASEREGSRKLILAIASLWLLSILIGGLLHTELLSGSEMKALRQRLPLLWFDRFMRTWGPLLPLPLVALRLAASYAHWAHASRQGIASNEGWRVRLHAVEVCAVYSGVASLRLVVYWLHCAGVYLLLSRAGLVTAVPLQLMSDHIFLGASLVSITSAEVIQCRAELRAPNSRIAAAPPAHARLLLRAGLVAGIVLLALTCGDMHFTARFFHERRETLLGAVLGLLAFQIPITWWLLWGFTLK